MKAVLASALTALVLVTTAWASNVTPAQLNTLSKRVTALEHRNAALGARVDAAETRLACFTGTAPLTVHDYRIDWEDGTSTVWASLEPSTPGEVPTLVVPTAASPSCAGAP